MPRLTGSYLDGEKVGGVVLRIDKAAAKGELELLFRAAGGPQQGHWPGRLEGGGSDASGDQGVGNHHPHTSRSATSTFYVNRCGFHIVEFWNKYQHGPAVPEEEEGNWSMDDEMFVFRKVITDKAPSEDQTKS
jgi:hypothetical protein